MDGYSLFSLFKKCDKDGWPIKQLFKQEQYMNKNNHLHNDAV
jgi:hypothetical protein